MAHCPICDEDHDDISICGGCEDPEITRLTARVAELEAQLAEARRDSERYFDLLNWITHLVDGVGKDGSLPSNAEWEDCLRQCRAAIDRAMEE